MSRQSFARITYALAIALALQARLFSQIPSSVPDYSSWGRGVANSQLGAEISRLPPPFRPSQREIESGTMVAALAGPALVQGPENVQERHRIIAVQQQQLEAQQKQLDSQNEMLERLQSQMQSLAVPAYANEPVSLKTEPVDGAVSFEPAGGSAFDLTGIDDISGSCDDCGKAVCEGAPHLCGICLEDLGWNKAGGWRIVPFGMLRGEAIYTEAATSADAVIFFLNPREPNVTEDSFTVHGKTSMLNFAITGPEVRGFETGGMVLMNFTGAQPLRNASGPNVLNAYGELKNEKWRFAFGRMFDLFGPIGPGSVNMGQQRGAGNIGIYRGALHVDRFFNVSESVKWTLSGRIAQQDVNDYLVLPQVRGTDNGWPNIETRLGLGLGPDTGGQRPLEVGVSGLIGQTRAVDPTLTPKALVSETWGVCVDTRLAGERFGANGEFWVGQAAGTYFMASLQSLNPLLDTPIRAIGGWGEISYKIAPNVTAYVGYGIDDPRDEDLGFVTLVGPGQRSRNEVAWGNVKWDVTEFFELAFEISHRETNFVLNPAASNSSMLYHFASTLKF